MEVDIGSAVMMGARLVYRVYIILTIGLFIAIVVYMATTLSVNPTRFLLQAIDETMEFFKRYAIIVLMYICSYNTRTVLLHHQYLGFKFLRTWR